MKVKLILAFILFMSLRASGQTFTMSWGSPSAFEAGEAVSKYGNDILIGGTKNDSAFVMRIKPNGEQVWLKEFRSASSSRTYVNSLNVTSDGYILGTGFSIGSGVEYGFYFKMDSTGNFAFLKGCGNHIYFKNMKEEAGSYVAFGAIKDGSGVDTDLKILTVNKSTGAVLTQTDCINLLATASYSFTDDMEGTAVIGTNLYTTGRFYLDFGSSTMRPFLIKHDLNGNVKWSKFLHKPPSGIARAYPQGILVLNNYLYIPYMSDEFCSGSCSDFYPGLIKADTAGNVIWDHTFNITTSNGEFNRGIATDGQYLYMGGYTNSNTAGSRDLSILKVDQNGTLIKARKFGTSSDEMFMVSFIQPIYCDSSYVYVTSGQGSASSSNVYLIKADTELNIACGGADLPTNTQVVVPYSAPIEYELYSENISFSNFTPSPYHSIVEASGCSVPNNIYDTISLSGIVTLDATFSGATGYSWSTGATTSSITVSADGTYTCEVIVGCCSFLHVFTVSTCIGTPPSLSFSQTGECGGSVFNLHVSGADTYTWTGNDSTYSGADLALVLNDTTTFTVTGTNTTGCSTTIIYTVSPMVLSPVALTYTGTLCSSQLTTFNLSGPLSYTYVLTDGAGTYTSFPFNYVLTDTVTFHLAFTDTSGCADDTSYFINVEQVNTSLDFGISDFTPCLGDFVTLNISNPGTFTWFDGTVNTPGNTISFTADTTVQYYLTGVSSSGCELADTILTITPYTIPDIGLTYEILPSSCTDKSYHFQMTGTALGTTWYLDSTLVSTAGSFNTVLSPGYHLVLLTASNNGCTSTIDTIVYNDSTVIIPQQVLIPNVFTPNGDGTNDFFKVTITDVTEFSITIFDRWGIEVYHSNDPDFRWNGIFKDDKIVDGMYLYLIHYISACSTDTSPQQIKGWLNISR